MLAVLSYFYIFFGVSIKMHSLVKEGPQKSIWQSLSCGRVCHPEGRTYIDGI
jgi:hypothetical protein